MTDKKRKGSLSQEEIDKAVIAGGKPGEIKEEYCGEHECDDDFKCNEPFSEGVIDMAEQQDCIFDHVCEGGDFECAKPFSCIEDHVST